MKYLVFPLTLLLSVLFSCEDTFEIDSRFETPQIVVDAWLTDQPVPQTITLTETQDYFDPSRPAGLADGTVSVCRTTDDTCFTFTHTTEGRYVWTPAPGQTIGTVGDAFELTIQRGEETYTAQSSLRRVPPIDSISVQFEDGLGPGAEDGLYSQLYARDFPGTGDTYWIRTTINDTLLNRPEEILLAYDATFDAGTATDGIAFIFPIRFGINRVNEDGRTHSLRYRRFHCGRPPGHQPHRFPISPNCPGTNPARRFGHLRAPFRQLPLQHLPPE